MGLDISYYSKVEFVRHKRDESDYGEEDDLVSLYNAKAFAARGAGLPGPNERPAGGFVDYGLYRATWDDGFGAGSYSGYNYWRSQLCRLALDVKPEEVWAEPSRFEGKPFYELIDFADNEGVIGPTVSAKLAKDFADNRAQAEATGDARFIGLYSRFQRAFETAATGGAVRFH